MPKRRSRQTPGDWVPRSRRSQSSTARRRGSKLSKRSRLRRGMQLDEFIAWLMPWARSKATGSGQDAIRRLAARLLAIYPEDGISNPQSWPLSAKLEPHLLRQEFHLYYASVVKRKLLDRSDNYMRGHMAAANLNFFDKRVGRDDALTKYLARLTADQLDVLGRTEEAKALRERYGVAEPEKPKSS
jgi:hypothetical protein